MPELLLLTWWPCHPCHQHGHDLIPSVQLVPGVIWGCCPWGSVEVLVVGLAPRQLAGSPS